MCFGFLSRLMGQCFPRHNATTQPVVARGTATSSNPTRSSIQPLQSSTNNAPDIDERRRKAAAHKEAEARKKAARAAARGELAAAADAAETAAEQHARERRASMERVKARAAAMKGKTPTTVTGETSSARDSSSKTAGGAGDALGWAQSVLEGTGVTVTNYGKHWHDGRAFCALIYARRPGVLPSGVPATGSDAAANLERAFAAAGKLGVVSLLDACDSKWWDKKSILPQLNEFRKVLG